MSVTHKPDGCEQRGYHLTPDMVLTWREITVGVTVAVALNSQVTTVWRLFEASSCETETSPLGLEQYAGVCQALWLFGTVGVSKSGPNSYLPNLYSYLPVP